MWKVKTQKYWNQKTDRYCQWCQKQLRIRDKALCAACVKERGRIPRYCSICDVELKSSRKKRCDECTEKFCVPRWKAIEKQRCLERKLELLKAYGGRCACCGETEPVFLCVDHIFNDGQADRKKLGLGDQMYRALKKMGWPKDRYQLLCFNCNWGKSHGGCPHKKDQTSPKDIDKCS